jgi:AP-3 complex subunit mu
MTLMEECECETMIEFLVDFRINMHSYTGLRIDGLDILKEPYTPFKGGRSFVRAGKCQIRMI